MQLTSYEVEKLLYKIKPSSPGLDNIPRWFFHNCSYEIADAVAHILNASFFCAVAPCQQCFTFENSRRAENRSRRDI